MKNNHRSTADSSGFSWFNNRTGELLVKNAEPKWLLGWLSDSFNVWFTWNLEPSIHRVFWIFEGLVQKYSTTNLSVLFSCISHQPNFLVTGLNPPSSTNSIFQGWRYCVFVYLLLDPLLFILLLFLLFLAIHFSPNCVSPFSNFV